jgi:DNA ligase-1
MIRPHFVTVDDIREHAKEEGLRSVFRGIGEKHLSDDYVERVLGIPIHLRFAVERSMEEGHHVADDAFASIPFYSLCKGLFLPLSMLQPEAVAHYFGIQAPPPPDMAAREALLTTFLAKPVGLDLVQKLACILGDPFCGRRSTFKRDSMISLLASMTLRSKKDLVNRLAAPGVGDVAVLFAEHRPSGKIDPALTSAEVIEALRFLPDAQRSQKFEILRSLMERMGKLESYFLAKLLLRKAAFGFDYQGPLIARAIAEAFSTPQRNVDADAVAHAIALTDAFHVARVLEEEGVSGLRKIQLQPLVPLRPALAAQGDAPVPKFPTWVERKYDGIRLMVHKSTDLRGNVLAGAFTRTRGDRLEDIAGLEASIRTLLCRNCIVDGELHGTIADVDLDREGGGGRRPATVYDILGLLDGVPQKLVRLRYTAFDLLYLDGKDLTQRPLRERRAYLEQLMAPVAALPLPVPIDVSQLQQAEGMNDVNRLFAHFRNQGYEGIIAKDPEGTYKIAQRDPSWVKRKPLETFDLVLLGGVLAVTTKERTGMFGSYIIGARMPDGSFKDVGDVAGLDIERDRIIQQQIVRDGLITGRRIERASSSGVRPGLELRPQIVVTIKCEGIVRDATKQEFPYSLRDPKIVVLRSDKPPQEADTTQSLEDLYKKERLS